MDDSDVVTFNCRESRESDDSDCEVEEHSAQCSQPNHSLDDSHNEDHESLLVAGDGSELISRISQCMQEIKSDLRESVDAIREEFNNKLSDVNVVLENLQKSVSLTKNNNSVEIEQASRFNPIGNGLRRGQSGDQEVQSLSVRVPSTYLNNARPDESRVRNVDTKSRGKLKPQTYDGGDDLDEYLTHFNLVAELNGWDYETKSLFLASSMIGATRTLLCELEPRLQRDYDAIVRALQNRYGSLHKAEFYRSQLQSNMLEKNESIPELAHSIRKLTGKAYPSAPSEVVELLALDFFTDALPDSDIRLRVREIGPKSISEAERIAVRLATHKQADKSRGRQHVRAVAQNEQSVSGSEKLEELTKKLSVLVGQMQRQSEIKSQYPMRGHGGPYANYQHANNRDTRNNFHNEQWKNMRHARVAGNESQAGSRTAARR